MTVFDRDGNRHTLFVTIGVMNVSTLDTPNATMPNGLRTFTTDKGAHVNALGDGRYQVAGSGLELFKQQP